MGDGWMGDGFALWAGDELTGNRSLPITHPPLPITRPPVTPIRIGVDLIEVKRITALLEKYGERFTSRVFTDRELAACHGRAAGTPSRHLHLRQVQVMQGERLAARFAAKEAVSKALGTGIGPVAWREIEILTDASGRPELVLSGAAAELAAELGLRQWAISLSHTQEQAIAFVVSCQ